MTLVPSTIGVSIIHGGHALFPPITKDEFISYLGKDKFNQFDFLHNCESFIIGWSNIVSGDFYDLIERKTFITQYHCVGFIYDYNFVHFLLKI